MSLVTDFWFVCARRLTISNWPNSKSCVSEPDSSNVWRYFPVAQKYMQSALCCNSTILGTFHSHFINFLTFNEVNTWDKNSGSWSEQMFVHFYIIQFYTETNSFWFHRNLMLLYRESQALDSHVLELFQKLIIELLLVLQSMLISMDARTTVGRNL